MWEYLYNNVGIMTGTVILNVVLVPVADTEIVTREVAAILNECSLPHVAIIKHGSGYCTIRLCTLGVTWEL